VSNLINTPLTDKELEFLDSFLLNRIDDDFEVLGLDQGVLCVSELDGLLTAIVCGPTTIMPSQWLPAVWGEVPPVFDDQSDAERILSLFVRHLNGIAIHLIEEPDTFEPMFLETERHGKSVLVVDEWCEGFMRGVELSKDAWIAGGTTIKDNLINILAFCEAGGWLGHDSDDRSAVEQRQLAIAPSVRAIHAYWLSRRPSEAAPEGPRTPVRHAEAQVGRSDPCPCGSGKKYKQCCLQ